MNRRCHLERRTKGEVETDDRESATEKGSAEATNSISHMIKA